MDIAALVQGQARPVRRRRRPPVAALALTALGGIALAGLLSPREAPAPETEPAAQAAPVAETPASAGELAWMLDPNPTLDAAAPRFGPAETQVAGFVPPETAEAPAMLAALPFVAAAEPEPAEPAPSVSRPQAPARLALTVPLPMRRPTEFRYEPREQAARMSPRFAARSPRESTRQVFSAAVTDDRSFFEKLFGGAPAASSGQAMAYAGLDNSAVDSAARRRLVPGPVAEPGVAVYDISAATVTLPSGEVLEAHSGLGAAQDNPDFVHLRMRGATPPGVYDLREREAPFHGVRAIRLTPVGGSAAIHGRDGILAHTYMLGPSGASNGCVVFRNYPRFLQAFLRGEVRRIVVVPGSAPGLFASRRGAPRRSASAADGN